MQQTVTLDDFDRRLLDLVRRDNLQPARVLADRVGLSESAVSRRLRRLRDAGVIVADVAVIDEGRLERALTMHVLVEMEREGTAVLDASAETLVVDGYGAPIEASNRANIELATKAGTLTLASGATLDLSSPDGVNRGRAELTAPRLGADNAEFGFCKAGVHP